MKCGLRVCRAGKGALPTAMGREAMANRRWQGDVSGLSFRELALVDKKAQGSIGARVTAPRGAHKALSAVPPPPSMSLRRRAPPTRRSRQAAPGSVIGFRDPMVPATPARYLRALRSGPRVTRHLSLPPPALSSCRAGARR